MLLEGALCPRCGSVLLPRATSCQCGWGKQQRRSEDNDRNCEYSEGDLRCKFAGAIAPGQNGPWYCRVHIREQGNRIARQALEQSQFYREPVVEFSPRTDPTLMKKLPMGASESMHDYAKRCREYCMSHGYRVKPVVSNEPVVSQPMREPGEDLEVDLVEI